MRTTDNLSSSFILSSHHLHVHFLLIIASSIYINNLAVLLQIDFHDTGSCPRVPSMTDHFGFTMAALNESGSVFANPCKGENSMSTLMYRPFSSWANNSEVRLWA